MNPIAFSIFGIDIRWYGILIASAMLIGTLLAMKEAKRIGYKSDLIIDLVLWTIPAALIGARLYYVFFTWDYFSQHLSEILNFRQGGLAIHGGIIGAFLGGYIFIRKHKLNFFKMADIAVPSLVLGQAIGRWGNFFNQEAHGGPVSDSFIAHFPAFIRDQMYISGQYYHPTFLYESIWCLIIFIFLSFYKRHKQTDGELLTLYLFLYSLERYIVEGLRTDSLMFGTFRVAQLVSLAFALIGLLGFWALRKIKSVHPK